MSGTNSGKEIVLDKAELAVYFKNPNYGSLFQDQVNSQALIVKNDKYILP